MGKFTQSEYSTPTRSIERNFRNSILTRHRARKGHHATLPDHQTKGKAQLRKYKNLSFSPQSSLLLNRMNRVNPSAQDKNLVKDHAGELWNLKNKKVDPQRQKSIIKWKPPYKKTASTYCPAALLKLVHRIKNPYLKLLAYKTCQICKQIKPDELTNTIYCSVCDDAYHRTCLPEPMEISEVRALSQFLCPQCNQNDDLNDSDSSFGSQQYSQPVAHLPDNQFPVEYDLYCQTLEWVVYQQKGNLKLLDLEEQFWTPRPIRSINLRNFTPIKHNKSYWVPLIKALSTTNHLYCHEQVYKNREVMELNKSINHRPQIVEMLSLKDEKIYEQFRALRDAGEAPPLTLQKCPIKGFMARALDFIQAKTILCEYAGQVVTHRDSLKVPNNDSIFTLLETGQSDTSLDVVPNRFANISKYFLGINNSSLENYEKINVQSVLFSYKGRNRIIYYTLRSVERGEQLYIDYNGGLADHYPTDTFH